MPTTIVKSIGSAVGRDYSSIQAWEDACPADLVTADQVWKGECYNDSEFSFGQLTFSGVTADSTRYCHLTAAAGHSFADHASKLTNTLKYDQSKGVGLLATYFYGYGVVVATPYTLIDKLQMRRIDGEYGVFTADAGGIVLDRCIVDGNYYHAYQPENVALKGGSKATNCLVIQRDGRIPGMLLYDSTAVNCTVVVPGGGGTAVALYSLYGTAYSYNCALFGFAGHYSGNGGGSFSGSHTASDLAALAGTSNQTSLVYADQFQSTTSAAHDFRAKETGSLDLNGTVRSEATVDIVGQTRHASTPHDRRLGSCFWRHSGCVRGHRCCQCHCFWRPIYADSA